MATRLRLAGCALARAKDVQAALDTAIADVEGARARVREAYDETYKYKSERRGAGPAAPAPDPLGIR